MLIWSLFEIFSPASTTLLILGIGLHAEVTGSIFGSDRRTRVAPPSPMPP